MTIAHFLLFLVLLLIILQEADIRITYKDRLKVRISLTIFAITFFSRDNYRLSPRKAIKAIKGIPLLLKSAKFALKRSDAKVLEFAGTSNVTTSDKVFASIPLLISISSLIAYIRANAKSFNNDNKQVDTKNYTTSIDILFKTRAINLIISAIIFLYYMVKRKIRRTIRNVRA